MSVISIFPAVEVASGHAAAQREAIDRILATVCDNNTGNCTLHNTALHKVTQQHSVESQELAFREKPYPVGATNLLYFYRYDSGQCILCGRSIALIHRFLKSPGNPINQQAQRTH